MKRTSQKPFSLEDFQPALLQLREAEFQQELIGGLAVSAWAELFLIKDERLEFDLPIYSKDMDLRGAKNSARFLAHEMRNAGAEIGSFVTATRKNAPEMGRVFAVQVTWRGQNTSIEVLERLPLLDKDIHTPPRGTALATETGVALLDPCSMFICKIHAANSRATTDASNDIKHLAILARIIPRFLDKVRVTKHPEYDAKEDAARLLGIINDCAAQTIPFSIPLPVKDIECLRAALHEHLRN